MRRVPSQISVCPNGLVRLDNAALGDDRVWQYGILYASVTQIGVPWALAGNCR